MDYKKEMGKRLKKLRKAANFSQSALASKLEGMSTSRIANYEQGARRFGIEEATQFAKLLNTTVAYLMCITNDPLESPDEKAVYSSDLSATEKAVILTEEIIKEAKIDVPLKSRAKITELIRKALE